MRIMIDIGHPAHVHLFKYFALIMQKKGHEILFTCREKEYEINLLETYAFKYKSFGKKYSSIIGKIWGLIIFDIKEFLEGLKFKPDLFLSHGSIYAAHAAFLLNRAHIALEDSGNWEQIKLYLPFTDVVLTPSVLPENLGKKQLRYKGYHELAYLHPHHYVNINEKLIDGDYAILRFVSWKATHDYGHSGFTENEKKDLIELLLNHNIQPVISSEGYLPAEYEEYKYSISPDKMHDALFGAKLFIGEGATMASEAGVLGVPSIYVNSIRRSYCEDQERYGLIYNYISGKGVIKKINDLLSMPNLRKEWQQRRQKLLEDKIDVTAFLVWFVENYPKSISEFNSNPKIQYQFR